jgi:hypothetical protein
MGDLSEPLGSMERLKILDFRGNPLCNLPKYRDYMVILSKNLCITYLIQNNWTPKRSYQRKDSTWSNFTPSSMLSKCVSNKTKAKKSFK